MGNKKKAAVGFDFVIIIDKNREAINTVKKIKFKLYYYLFNNKIILYKNFSVNFILFGIFLYIKKVFI